MSALAHSLESERPAHPVSALALVETFTATEVFSGNGLDGIIERIENEARSTALDISTDRGRKEVASLAHKIAKSKTALDKMGKELASGWKEQAKKVDAERSRAWDRLEALQKEVRQPLTEWENREKDRIAKHEAAIMEISNSGTYTTANWQSLSVEAMNGVLKELLTDKTDWQEFSVRAKQALEAASDAIAAAILRRQAHDAEQTELARLRKEEEERKQRAHEDRLKAEAADKARVEAEDKARKIAEAEAARVAAEQVKAEQDRQRIQLEKEKAEARARRAERATQDAIDKAEREKALAAEKAKKDAELAAQRERQRINDEKRAEAEATAKREANKKHRDRIETEALDSLLPVLSSDNFPDCWAVGRALIKAIANGQIPHIKIQY